MTVPTEVKPLLAFLENSQHGEFSFGSSFKMYKGLHSLDYGVKVLSTEISYLGTCEK
jgi:hypothetical protein